MRIAEVKCVCPTCTKGYKATVSLDARLTIRRNGKYELTCAECVKKRREEHERNRTGVGL